MLWIISSIAECLSDLFPPHTCTRADGLRDGKFIVIGTFSVLNLAEVNSIIPGMNKMTPNRLFLRGTKFSTLFHFYVHRDLERANSSPVVVVQEQENLFTLLPLFVFPFTATVLHEWIAKSIQIFSYANRPMSSAKLISCRQLPPLTPVRNQILLKVRTSDTGRDGNKSALYARCIWKSTTSNLTKACKGEKQFLKWKIYIWESGVRWQMMLSLRSWELIHQNVFTAYFQGHVIEVEIR